ncbi:MAG: glycosyltransferase family 2 protein [Tepidisphaeraceae bacterium]
MSGVGVVTIGRNEGERLRRCLASVVGRADAVVYVDSNSSDGSVGLARELGATVVELDLSTPFTAARARNAGFEKLMSVAPGVEFVQFVDGDCEVVTGWLEKARGALVAPNVAVVCGRRRERFPDATVYNKLCDIEWNSAIGEVKTCGGDAMIRVSAFREVNGFDPSVIAGEEPELCVRLRGKGYTILRIDADMTLHDAAMTRFGQWWKRNVRSGHAYAEGRSMHGRPPERHWIKENRSNWIWGLIWPVLGLGAAWPTRGLSLLAMVVGYELLHWRSTRHATRRGLPRAQANVYAAFIVLGKIPQALGQLKYWTNRLSGRRSKLIEYKGAPAVGI